MAERLLRLVLVVVAVLALLGARPLAAQVCGDGQVTPPEQCDDGNAFRLDGCTPDCRYEHVQRIEQLALSGSLAPAACTPANNAFGRAFSSLGRSGLNSAIAGSLADGSFNQLLELVDLDDPAGRDDLTVELGGLSAAPDPAGPATTLDAWFLGDPTQLDADDLPLHRSAATITAGELAAGPDTLSLAMSGGTFTIRDSRTLATVGSATSLPSPPPAQLAPAFAAFEVLDASDAAHGLCGNITVGSLAAVPVPAIFTASGDAACFGACPGSRTYTACAPGSPVGAGCNSLLDVLVSGCSTSALCLAVVLPTQPDVGVGDSPPNTLAADPTTGKVTVSEPDDAYSTYFTFASRRVHLTNGLSRVFDDGFESGGTGAWSTVVPAPTH